MRFGSSDFFRPITVPQLIEFILRVLFLRGGYFPVGFGGVALLFGNKVLLCQGIVTVKISMCPHLFRFCTIKVGLRGGDIFYAITMFALFVFGLSLCRSGAGFGNLFGTEAALGFFSSRARLSQSSLQFLVVESNQDLTRLHGVPFAHENFFNAPANFGAHTYVARFYCAGALQ